MAVKGRKHGDAAAYNTGNYFRFAALQLALVGDGFCAVWSYVQSTVENGRMLYLGLRHRGWLRQDEARLPLEH